nr:flagellar hook-length control protein FliK [Bacillus alkalicola]
MLNRNQFQQLSNGIQQISLKLHPQSLGRLDINIQQVNGILVAKMMTTTAAARELIEGQLNQLRQAFQGQNIQVDRIEITQQQTQQTNQNPFKDSQEGQGENRREESLKQDDLEQQDDEDNFQEFLQDLIDMKV